MKKLIVLITMLVTLTACLPVDINQTAEVNIAIENCEAETAQGCVVMAVPESQVGNVWALYWVEAEQSD